MRHHRKLIIKATVSEYLIKHLCDIQKLLKFSDAGLSLIDVEVEGVKPTEFNEKDFTQAARDLKTGVMVTGGLDTFYILQEHLEEINSFVYIRRKKRKFSFRHFGFYAKSEKSNHRHV